MELLKRWVVVGETKTAIVYAGSHTGAIACFRRSYDEFVSVAYESGEPCKSIIVHVSNTDKTVEALLDGE